MLVHFNPAISEHCVFPSADTKAKFDMATKATDAVT